MSLPLHGDGCGVAGALVAGAGSAGPAATPRLDQERDNRFNGQDSWRDRVREGEIVLVPARSGGAFDPLGRRAVDVWRVDDLKSVCESLGGRWVLVTLTVNRSLFANPEEAYRRCNERVRRVMHEVCPRNIYFVAFEVQTKTGYGWPHWHAMAWVPDGRSEVALKAAALERWRVRADVINMQTGEVRRSFEQIGFVDVSTARHALAAGTYIAKYLTKRWPAVPAWMGESRRRFRKVRLSPGTYDVLERLHRHDRQHGARKQRTNTGRRTRKLFERMALSGSVLNAFRKTRDQLAYTGTVCVPIDQFAAVVDRLGGVPVQLGAFHKCRVVVSSSALRFLRLEAGRWRGQTSRYLTQQLERYRAAWEMMQMGIRRPA